MGTRPCGHALHMVPCRGTHDVHLAGLYGEITAYLAPFFEVLTIFALTPIWDTLMALYFTLLFFSKTFLIVEHSVLSRVRIKTYLLML